MGAPRTNSKGSPRRRLLSSMQPTQSDQCSVRRTQPAQRGERRAWPFCRRASAALSLRPGAGPPGTGCSRPGRGRQLRGRGKTTSLSILCPAPPSSVARSGCRLLVPDNALSHQLDARPFRLALPGACPHPASRLCMPCSPCKLNVTRRFCRRAAAQPCRRRRRCGRA